MGRRCDAERTRFVEHGDLFIVVGKPKARNSRLGTENDSLPPCAGLNVDASTWRSPGYEMK